MTKSIFGKSAAVLMAAFAAASLALCRYVPVYAETTLERLQRAKEEKEKTEAAMENTQDKRESLKIAKNSLLGELSTLNDDLAQVSANLESIEADIAAKKEEILKAKDELEQAEDTEKEQYENMKLRIKSMYESGASFSYLSFLFNAQSFSDFLNKSDYVEEINKYDQKMLKQYKETRKEVEEFQARLENELDDLHMLEESVTLEKSKVTALVHKTSQNVESYSGQIKDAEETIDVLSSMIDEQEQSIAALQKQYEEELAKSRLAAQSSWRDISEVKFEEGDRMLLANLIYCEAGAEPYDGQLAVGAVVINRELS